MALHLRKSTEEALNALHAAHRYAHDLELQLERARLAEVNAYSRYRELRREALIKEIKAYREELNSEHS